MYGDFFGVHQIKWTIGLVSQFLGNTLLPDLRVAAKCHTLHLSSLKIHAVAGVLGSVSRRFCTLQKIRLEHRRKYLFKQETLVLSDVVVN
jgi:hypothetical protein